MRLKVLPRCLDQDLKGEQSSVEVFLGNFDLWQLGSNLEFNEAADVANNYQLSDHDMLLLEAVNPPN